MLRYGGEGDRAPTAGFPDPHQLCTSPLVCNVYGEALHVVFAGEGKSLNCTPVPCYEGCCQGTIPDNF